MGETMLSDEQMNCVSGFGIASWEPVERPTGRQDLPPWVRGAHIDWMHGVSNPPDITLKVAGDVFQWDDKRWTREGKKTYIARHPDGRACVLYHDGALTEMAAWRVYIGDEPFTYKWIVPEHRASTSESWLQAAEREGRAHVAEMLGRPGAVQDLQGKKHPRENLRLVVKSLLCTTQQAGFGGDGYLLEMLDGTEVLLRGPWHGGAPSGYVEVCAWDATEDRPTARWMRDRPWHRRGGRAGLYLTEDLFLRITATHCAHAPMARVVHSYGSRVEPYRAEWGMPKAAIYDLEWNRARRSEPAGEFWRVYWDGRERYCGSLRVPTYGYRPEVTDRIEVAA